MTRSPDAPQPLSKTAKKKRAERLQHLGETLSQLSASQLERFNLDPDLFNALVQARSITANVASRRHRQYIGTLMRQVDPEPILATLERLKALPPGIYTPEPDPETVPGPDIDPQREACCQELLERLLAWDDDAMETILSAGFGVERQRLRQLIRNANKDNANRKSAGQRERSKAFQALQEMVTRL